MVNHVRHYKIHQQGSNVPIHLYQAQGSCSLLGRLQVPPGNLLEIAVDVHFVKSTVIRQFRIRFQVFSQFLCRFFVIQFPMEIRCELQDLCDMQVVVPQNRRIPERYRDYAGCGQTGKFYRGYLWQRNHGNFHGSPQH